MWDMARRPCIQYNGKAFRTPAEARWAVTFDLLKIPISRADQGVLPDGGSFIPSFLLPSMKCYFEVCPTTPTKQERDGLGWLAGSQCRTERLVSVSYGDIGQSPD